MSILLCMLTLWWTFPLDNVHLTMEILMDIVLGWIPSTLFRTDYRDAIASKNVTLRRQKMNNKSIDKSLLSNLGLNSWDHSSWRHLIFYEHFCYLLNQFQSYHSWCCCRHAAEWWHWPWRCWRTSMVIIPDWKTFNFEHSLVIFPRKHV